jgi:hypothetical protein
MEEIEVTSWLTLDALKKAADAVETAGNLHSGHCMSVFCMIEDDYLELCYSDSAANYIRRYDDKDEFEVALEQRKEEVGETPYEEDKEPDEEEEDDEEEYEEEDEEDEGSTDAEDESDSI